MRSAPLWTAEQVAAATQGLASGDFAAMGVSIDSRTLEPGDLFVALKGPNFDGHRFVGDAFARGAAAALVEHGDSASGRPVVTVPNTDIALTALGQASRARTKAKVVAITGSVGKTSTKEALAAALAAQGKTASTKGNLNNQWGLPLSLARMAPDAAYGVFELGMNHAGELGPLSQLARPDIGIITTIAAVHLEHFSSTFDIAEAKAELFQGMAGGTAILNRDNAYFPLLACLASSHGVARILGFGQHPEAQIRLEHCTFAADGSDITAKVRGRSIRYRLAVAGRPAAINSLAVLGAVAALGADVDAAANSLSTFQGLAGRGLRHHVTLPSGAFELVDESYNASPVSMRAAIEVLGTVAPADGGRRIAVLGDMLELGPQATAMHAALAEDVVKASVDLVFTAGPLMAALDAALPASVRGGHTANATQLAPLVLAAVRPGDVVTVKGSHGMRLDRIVDALLAAGARH